MAEGLATTPPLKVLRVAFGVALVCALAVSFTAVTLRPHYLANLEAERMARLASILEALPGAIRHGEVEARVIGLDDGQYADAIDPDTHDASREAGDPAKSVAIPPSLDLAGLKRREKHALVYLIRDADGRISAYILPVRGTGYQSALHGFLALAADAREILALRFYRQAETPGLGSEIQNPAWEALWPGRQAFDDDGRVSIRVSRDPGVTNRVDAISGATRTSQGVDGLLRFWLGEFGFGPFLERVRAGGE